MTIQMSALFSEKKAAETAAYFLLRARERRANITLLKLMKLMYLAERRSYQLFGFPIIGDRLVSMPHGPVLSKTLDLMNAGEPSENKDWFHLIAEKNGRDLELNPKLGITIRDLRELSDSDVDVLDSIWQEFGRMSAHQLRAYTHNTKNCPEWQDPDGSSVPISLNTLLISLGYSVEDAKDIVERTETQAWINAKLAG